MTTWQRWLLRRLVLALFVVLAAASVAFAALHLIPGDPVRVLLGTSSPSPEVLAQTRHDLGFDRPVAEQYALFVGGLVRGDLGESYQLQQPVSAVIGAQLWPTAELALAGLALALAVAVPLAVLTAGRRVPRALSSAVELVVASSPGFWVGVLLLTVFSFRLHLFPAAGGSGLDGLVLPAVTLALSMVGAFTQVLREGVERALAEPFALSARARGTGETALRLRHALRHALLPLVTLSGWSLGTLFSGAVIVETVFSRQGVGRVMAAAIESRELPLVTGIVVVAAVVFTVVGLVVDVAYRVVDPRMREVAS